MTPEGYPKPIEVDREGLSRLSDQALLKEYQEMRKASFGRMYGHNAVRRGNACVEELLKRGITEEPNLFGAMPVKFMRR